MPRLNIIWRGVSQMPKDLETKFQALGTKKFRDPVCGQEVKKGNVKSVHKNKTYYFCCAAFQFVFERDPAKFVRSTSNRSSKCFEKDPQMFAR